MEQKRLLLKLSKIFALKTFKNLLSFKVQSPGSGFLCQPRILIPGFKLTISLFVLTYLLKSDNPERGAYESVQPQRLLQHVPLAHGPQWFFSNHGTVHECQGIEFEQVSLLHSLSIVSSTFKWFMQALSHIFHISIFTIYWS